MMTKHERPTILNYFSPVIMIGLGVWHFLRHGIDALTIITLVLGFLGLYLVLFNHSLLHKVLAFLTKLWYPVGQFITIILFIVTFFLVFAPVGLVLRLLKKDILNRDFKSNALTYWIDRPIKEDSNYTQQF